MYFGAMNCVCRVCGKDKNLYDLYTKPLIENVHNICFMIWQTTGVEIKETDKVSKMVCQQCLEIANQLIKYRSNINNNERLMKEECGQPYEPPPVDPDEIRKLDAQMVNELFGVSTHSNNTLNAKKHQKCTVAPNFSGVQNQETGKKLERKQPSTVSGNLSSNTPKTSSVLKQTARKSTTTLNITTKQRFQNEYECLNIGIKWESHSQQYEIVNKEKPKSFNIPKIGNLHIEQVPVVNEENTKSFNIPEKRRLHIEQDSIVNEQKTKRFNDSKKRKLHNEQHEVVSEEKTKFIYMTRNRGSRIKQDEVINEKRTHFLTRAKKRQLQNESDEIINEVIKKKGDTTIKLSFDKIINETIRECFNRTERPGFQNKKSKTVNEVTTESLTKNGESQDKQNEIVQKTKTTNIKNLASDSGENGTMDTTNSCIKNNKLEFSYTDSENVMCTGKLLSVQLCKHCTNLFNTKKELIDHEKTHLTCKFCKRAHKNFELLYKHQKESCHVMIVKCLPSIPLIKVDSIPAIVNNYPEAFLNLIMKSELNIASDSSETPQDDKASPEASCLNADMANEGNDKEIKCFSVPSIKVDSIAAIVNSYPEAFLDLIVKPELNIALDIFESTQGNTTLPQASYLNPDSVANEDNNTLSQTSCLNTNSVTNDVNNALSQTYCLNTDCVANEGIEEVECLGITKDPNTYTNWRESMNKTIEKCFLEKNFNERRMLNLLFRKYFLLKTDKSLETGFTPNNYIDCSVSNGIQINHFARELKKYRVPLNYEYNDGLSATFMKHQLGSKEFARFDWGNKKVIIIVKTSITKNASLTNKQPLQIKIKGKMQKENHSNTNGIFRPGGDKQSYVPIQPTPARLLQPNYVCDTGSANSNNTPEATNQTSPMLQSNYNKQPNPPYIQIANQATNLAPIATVNVTLPTSLSFIEQNSAVQSASVLPPNQTQPYGFINILPSSKLTINHTQANTLSQSYQQTYNDFVSLQTNNQNPISSTSRQSQLVQLLESSQLLTSQLQYNQNSVRNSVNINDNIFVVHPIVLQNEQTCSKTTIPFTENHVEVATQKTMQLTTANNDTISSVQSLSTIGIGNFRVKGLCELN